MGERPDASPAEAFAVVTVGTMDEWWETRALNGADDSATMETLDRGVSNLEEQLPAIDPSLRIADRGIPTMPNVLVAGTAGAIGKLLGGKWPAVYASMPMPTHLTIVTFNGGTDPEPGAVDAAEAGAA